MIKRRCHGSYGFFLTRVEVTVRDPLPCLLDVPWLNDRFQVWENNVEVGKTFNGLVNLAQRNTVQVQLNLNTGVDIIQSTFGRNKPIERRNVEGQYRSAKID